MRGAGLDEFFDARAEILVARSTARCLDVSARGRWTTELSADRARGHGSGCWQHHTAEHRAGSWKATSLELAGVAGQPAASVATRPTV